MYFNHNPSSTSLLPDPPRPIPTHRLRVLIHFCKLFCFRAFFLIMYLCPGRLENSDLPVAGVIGSRELPIIMGAGNRTCVLCKSSVCSYH